MKQFSQSRYVHLVVIEWEFVLDNVSDPEDAVRTCFVDHSFFVSYYIGNQNELAARNFMARGTNQLITAEVIKCSFEKVFKQSNESHEKRSSSKYEAGNRPNFDFDCRAEVVSVLPLDPEALRIKIEELNSHTPKLPVPCLLMTCISSRQRCCSKSICFYRSILC
jgi:hypothetical protein